MIPEYVIETKQTEAEGYEAMEKFFQSDDMPTGIYCANDISAIGMLKCLNKFRNRYYMPSIISSDDIQEAQFTKPMLTTVSLPKEDMGKFALYLFAGPTERRTFRYCPDGTGRKAGDPEQAAAVWRTVCGAIIVSEDC